MNDKKLTHNDFLQRLDIRDVLLDAGYRQNRRFGLRLSSFIRTDSEGKRIRGDKFVITQHGKCCSQPPRQKEYNVVSFIKEHPTLFAEYHEGIDPNRGEPRVQPPAEHPLRRIRGANRTGQTRPTTIRYNRLRPAQVQPSRP